jgi:hypothetical protein
MRCSFLTWQVIDRRSARPYDGSHGRHRADPILEKEPPMELNQFADRYVSVWNEPDPERRRQQIAALWVDEGEHYVESGKFVGLDALERRVIEAHNEFVRDAGNRFRAVPGARREGDVVTFYWEMLPAKGDTVLGKGLEFMIVTEKGQIIQDFQFYPA